MPRQADNSSTSAKTRDWTQSPNHINCFPSKRSKQTVAKFWETLEATAFHTSELASATKEINGVLAEVARADHEQQQVLSFIVIESRLLLVWARDTLKSPRGLRSDAKMSQTVKALRLRSASRTRRRLNDGADPITYTWLMDSKGNVTCTPSDVDASCHLTNLWQTVAPTAFRPRELMQATTKVQHILDEVGRNNTNLERKLAIIIYDYRPMLVWTTCGMIGPEDELPIVRKALRLKLE